MRVSDFVFKYLADLGVRHAFIVTGGGAMHLNDALRREERIRFICNHHEQACAMAAEGYTRASGELCVVSVTTGPGATNAITGALGQWLDSTPALYISGQVKFETSIASVPGCNLRQLGDQEIDIIKMVSSITKYAKMVTDPMSIKTEIDRAVTAATTGRFGPAWLDIPLDIQGAMIDETKLQSDVVTPAPIVASDDIVKQVFQSLQKAKRPVLIAGHGIRLAKAQREFRQLIEALKIPVVTTFNGMDLLESNSPYYVGRIGTLGSRAGNFALQNADFVLCLGTRNNIRQVSYNWASFARFAKIAIVDVDKAELTKKTINGHILVHSDAKVFVEKLLSHLAAPFTSPRTWLEWCLVRREKYPVVLEEYKRLDRPSVHPYSFIEQWTAALNDKAIVVGANGSACVVLWHASVVKLGQRYIWNSGCASMGFDLPAGIGAALACNREVYSVAGDGSIQMNLQELQTIKHYQLPVKIIYLNNLGYRSIQQTQNTFFNGNFIGCDEESGLSFPEAEKLATAYGLGYMKISNQAEVKNKIDELIRFKGPIICEVMLELNYTFSPKLSSEKLPNGQIISKPLEDLFPFLDRKEFAENMLVKEPDKSDEK